MFEFSFFSQIPLQDNEEESGRTSNKRILRTQSIERSGVNPFSVSDAKAESESGMRSGRSIRTSAQHVPDSDK